MSACRLWFSPLHRHYRLSHCYHDDFTAPTTAIRGIGGNAARGTISLYFSVVDCIPGAPYFSAQKHGEVPGQLPKLSFPKWSSKKIKRQAVVYQRTTTATATVDKPTVSSVQHATAETVVDVLARELSRSGLHCHRRRRWLWRQLRESSRARTSTMGRR